MFSANSSVRSHFFSSPSFFFRPSLLFFHICCSCNLSNSLAFSLSLCVYSDALSLGIPPLSFVSRLIFFCFFSSIHSDFFPSRGLGAHTPMPFQHPPNLTSRSIFLKFTQTYISNTPHPLSSPSSDCTCVPGFGLDTAQVASVESGKCSSCPICHLEQVDRRRRGGRSKVLFG